jgi:hypothetical protein
MADPLSEEQNINVLEEARQQQQVDPVVNEALKVKRKKRLPPSKIAAACGLELLKKSDSGIGCAAAPDCVSAGQPTHDLMPQATGMPTKQQLPPNSQRVPVMNATTGLQKGAWCLKYAALPSVVGAVQQNASYGTGAWNIPSAPSAAPSVKTDSGNGWSDSKSTNISSSPHAKTTAQKLAALRYPALAGATKAALDSPTAGIYGASGGQGGLTGPQSIGLGAQGGLGTPGAAPNLAGTKPLGNTAAAKIPGPLGATSLQGGLGMPR